MDDAIERGRDSVCVCVRVCVCVVFGWLMRAIERGRESVSNQLITKVLGSLY
jgi:hypothetical protein